MERDDGSRNMKRVVWGIFLIALGAMFLLERFGVIGDPLDGNWWPAIFVVLAINHVIERRIGSALMFASLGAWFFICELHWQGFTYGNSWPLLLVGIGASIVLKALLNERPRGRVRVNLDPFDPAARRGRGEVDHD